VQCSRYRLYRGGEGGAEGLGVTVFKAVVLTAERIESPSPSHRELLCARALSSRLIRTVMIIVKKKTANAIINCEELPIWHTIAARAFRGRTIEGGQR
jgi:hypothetical protein